MSGSPARVADVALPRLCFQLERRYAGLASDAVLGTYHDGGWRQLIRLTGSREALIATGLITGEQADLTRRFSFGHPVFTEFGDSVYVRPHHAGEELTLHTGFDVASSVDPRYERRVHSKKIQRQVERMLRPFVRGTWKPTT